MNVAIINPAPGLPPRRAFNVDDIRRMVDAGVLGEDENIELVEGEIVVMAAKSYAHERIKNALVEVAKTGLCFDKGRKAALYAKLGVSEYWVVNTNKRVTSIHREPSESGWASIVDYGVSDRLT